MHSWQIPSFGITALRRVEAPDPRPGPGEVRLRVRAASLNYRDLMMVRGDYNPRQPLPLVPLSDGVGVIDVIGPGVEPALVGQRVAGMFAPYWSAGPVEVATMRATLGGPLPGMASTHVILPAAGVAPVPEFLDDAEAATLPCAALTAWSALVVHGQIAAGQTVLVQGTGGVASFALDFARLHGAAVVATSRRKDRLAALTERGAAAVIDSGADAGWGERVRAWTGGRGVDHVIEVGGADTLQQSLRAIGVGGTISLIGVLGGVRTSIDLTAALMKQVRLQGVFVGSRTSFVAMTRALTLHRLRPRVDRVFAFDALPEALRYLEAGKHHGKVCVSMV